MAITISDLLAFNDVETTDVLQGIVELPFIKPIPFIAGLTFSREYEELTRGQRGSQALIRKLGKTTVKKAKVTVDGALDFSHTQTADGLEVIPIDDVVSASEKIYEAVDAARQSATGALKAEIALRAVVEGVQENITDYLLGSVPFVDDTEALTPENIKDHIIDAMALVENPNILMVSPAVHTILLKLVTTGEFIANSREDVIRTGILGYILGLTVVKNPDFTGEADFVVYDATKFPVFVLFNEYDIVGAIDFKGSYARAQMITGGGRVALDLEDDGKWGVGYFFEEDPEET